MGRLDGGLLRDVSTSCRNWCSAGQASVGAGIATGEEAFDDAFDPRHAFGQRLDVFAQIGQIASDLGKVSVDFLSKRLHVSAEFGSQGVIVGTSFPPEGEHEANHGRAYGEDCDEFGGHGRLHGVGLLTRRPCGVNGRMACGSRVDL